MLNIHWRKVIVLFIVMGVAGRVCAQRTSVINMPTYDDKQIHYGFQLALNNTGFRLRNSEFGLTDTTINSAKPTRTTGFSLGFIFNYRLNDYMDLRVLPTVSFYERHVKFNYSDARPEVDELFETTFIEFPMLLKYKSHRRGNHRFYMLGGIKPAIEVGAKKKEKKDTQLRTKSLDFSLEYGIGADIYYPLFKFAPEVRFSLGLVNLLVKDDNEFANYLDRISTYTITFSTMFE